MRNGETAMLFLRNGETAMVKLLYYVVNRLDGNHKTGKRGGRVFDLV